MTKVVRTPAVPLSQSVVNGKTLIEKSRMRGRSDGSSGSQTEDAPIPMTSTVNGTTFIVPPSANEPE